MDSVIKTLLLLLKSVTAKDDMGMGGCGEVGMYWKELEEGVEGQYDQNAEFSA